MTSETDKKKQAKLTRIRENQRNSRARRQQHIHDLEQQVASLKQQLQQKDAEHRLDVQRLEAENGWLRGVWGGTVVGASVVGGENRKVAIPRITRNTAGPSRQTGPSSSCGGYTSQVPDPTASFDSGGKSQTVCGCMGDGDESWPDSPDILSSTLCAIAEELITQHNTRGVDMAEIQKKLWNGFTRGVDKGDGCRVQNQVLFQVLDEISDG